MIQLFSTRSIVPKASTNVCLVMIRVYLGSMSIHRTLVKSRVKLDTEKRFFVEIRVNVANFLLAGSFPELSKTFVRSRSVSIHRTLARLLISILKTLFEIHIAAANYFAHRKSELEQFETIFSSTFFVSFENFVLKLRPIGDLRFPRPMLRSFSPEWENIFITKLQQRFECLAF